MSLEVSNKYHIYAGTSRGALIFSDCNPKSKLKFSLPHGQQSETTALVQNDFKENQLIVGYENGGVDFYDTHTNKYKEIRDDLEGEGSVTGLGYPNRDVLIASRKNGVINIIGDDGKIKENFHTLQDKENSTLNSMICNKNRKNIIATGGECNDVQLWDIEANKQIFKAKSMGHDELNLPIPTTIRGLTFFPTADHHVCACTKEGHVLLYDERAQRRPVLKFHETKASWTCISSGNREKQILSGTTKGYLHLIDFKAPKTSMNKTFTKSFTGSITDIVCDPFEPYVITSSLDRFLRIHNIETKELIYKTYCKQNLTKVVMKPIIKEEF